MKNRDILMDVIGDTDEELIPGTENNRRGKGYIRWAAIGGACTAAAVAGAVLLPGLGRSKVPWTQDVTDSGSSSQNGAVQSSAEDPAGASPGSAVVLASPVYPKIPDYPGDEGSYEDYQAWAEAIKRLRDQPQDYKRGMKDFFRNSAGVFMSDTEGGNRVYSPLSLYMALGMTAEVTDGDSRQQLLDALSEESIEDLRKTAKSIWQVSYMDDGMAKCTLANSLWTRAGADYNSEVLNTVAENYYASSFSGDPSSEEYTALFQSWLNEQTGGLLEDYVSGIELDPEMILTLASTVDYSGKWQNPFQESNTARGQFSSPGGQVECDFMNAERDMSYYAGEHFGSVSMYLENNGQMKLILPDEGVTPEELFSDEEALDFMMTQYSEKNTSYVSVTLSVPKFDVSSGIDLTEGLQEMGITDIFSASSADFTPLTDAQGLAVTKAEQDARVVIDEEGCRASALTVMLAAGAALPDGHVDFILDRPFVFEIMSENGLPLFVGVVNSPAQ